MTARCSQDEPAPRWKLWISRILGRIGHYRRKFKNARQGPAANPDYVRFYSLRPAPDESHTIPMPDLDGTTWYLETQPAFNLNDFYYSTAFVTGNGQGEYGIYIQIIRSKERPLYAWSGAQIDKPIGVVVASRLVQVAVLKTRLSSICLRLGHNDLQTYLKVVKTMNAGGTDRH